MTLLSFCLVWSFCYTCFCAVTPFHTRNIFSYFSARSDISFFFFSLLPLSPPQCCSLLFSMYPFSLSFPVYSLKIHKKHVKHFLLLQYESSYPCFFFFIICYSVHFIKQVNVFVYFVFTFQSSYNLMYDKGLLYFLHCSNPSHSITIFLLH